METREPARLPGLLYGIGFGGFVDGILLHQILQWHHMLSATGEYPVDTVAGLEVNVLADGFFHVVTWLAVLAASLTAFSAWRAGRLAPPWRAHLGMMLIGWGLFNLVEGLVNHQILKLHHVRDDLGGPLSWDLGFLLLGVLLIAAGWVLQRRRVRRTA